MIKILLFLGITFFANPVYAACTGPVGVAGDLMYNTTYDVFQGCTARGWYAFHEVLSCESGPIGTRCASDGAIYAGDTVGGARMYAAACDVGMSWDGTKCIGTRMLRQWKTSNTSTAGLSPCSQDGVANTNAMAAAGIALHPAAEACRAMGPEWYLPAEQELDLLYDNLVDQNGDNIPGGPLFGTVFDFYIVEPAGFSNYYWSSRQGAASCTSATAAMRQLFMDGVTGGISKQWQHSVRCVRR